MFYILVEVGKYALSLLLFLLGLACLKHYNAMQRVKFYADQGMSPLPGYDKFFYGNAFQMLNYNKER